LRRSGASGGGPGATGGPICTARTPRFCCWIGRRFREGGGAGAGRGERLRAREGAQKWGGIAPSRLQRTRARHVEGSAPCKTRKESVYEDESSRSKAPDVHRGGHPGSRAAVGRGGNRSAEKAQHRHADD